MKSKAIKLDPKLASNKYPGLYTSEYSGNVYLLTSPANGTKVFQGKKDINPEITIGSYKPSWHGRLIPFKGKVVLKD